MGARKKRSRKRSAANETGELHKHIFYLDECLGDYIVYEILVKAGFKVEKAIDHFPKGTIDTDWLQKVGDLGWIILSKDGMIRRRRLEIEALMGAGVAAFVLTSASVKGEINAAAFLKARNKMLRLLKKYRKPFIALVTRDGTVSMYQSSDDLNNA